MTKTFNEKLFNAFNCWPYCFSVKIYDDKEYMKKAKVNKTDVE